MANLAVLVAAMASSSGRGWEKKSSGMEDNAGTSRFRVGNARQARLSFSSLSTLEEREKRAELVH